MASRRMVFWQTVTGALALLGTVLLATSGSATATDSQSFDSRIGRSATDDSSRPKAMCVCQDGSEFHGLAGFLERQSITATLAGGIRQAFKVFCFVEAFDVGTLELDFLRPCNTFVPLPR